MTKQCINNTMTSQLNRSSLLTQPAAKSNTSSSIPTLLLLCWMIRSGRVSSTTFRLWSFQPFPTIKRRSEMNQSPGWPFRRVKGHSQSSRRWPCVKIGMTSKSPSCAKGSKQSSRKTCSSNKIYCYRTGKCWCIICKMTISGVTAVTLAQGPMAKTC